jgi:O-antigen/teichoic acid export membrane protein
MSVLYIIRRNKHQFNNYDFNEVKKLAIKYKDYPLFQAPTSMLDTLSVQAPIFFISKYFDAIIVGFFSLVLKILSAPAALIAKSTGQVFFQRVSEHAKTSPELLLNDIYNVALKLLIVAVLTFLPLLFYGPEIFAAVFGSDWAQAGTYAQILVYAVVIRFVVSPLSTIFLAIDKIKIGSLWQFLYFITTFIVLFIAINYEPKIFLWFYVVNELVMYAFYFGLMIYSVKSFVLSKELDK